MGKWTLYPNRTALLIIDVQNDYAHKDGYLGNVLGKKISRARRILGPLRRLIAACEQSSTEVIWVQSVRTGDNNERVKHRILPPNFSRNPDWLGGPLKGSWGAEIVEELRPPPRTRVIQKTRNSAFFKTDLEERLRKRGVDTVLFTGVATNICVESSLRDAYFRDFDVILVEDCCAALDGNSHDATVRTVRTAYGAVTSSDEIIRMMSQARV